ncbi:MAG: type II secretion system F family protein [Chloroflexi bacterium]|nr:type II secretion system F family protein [Chloroflexota bacterium]
MLTVSSAIAILAFVSIIAVFLGLHRVLAVRVDVASRLGTRRGNLRSTSSEPTYVSPLGARMERAIGDKGFATRLQRELAKANLKLTVSEFLMLNLVCILVLFVLAYLVSQNLGLALLGAVAGFYLPKLYLKQRQRGRLKAFNNQLGDTIMLISNSLRSGYSLLQSLELVARESPDPIGDEFSRVVREVNLGLSPEEALAHLVARIDSEDLDLMVTAINVQHEVGGNLAQVLDSIASTIRERVRIKGEIKSLTAQQTLGGYVIAFLPVALGVILFLLNSRYMMQLFSFEKLICMPVITLPICSGVLIILGFISIRKITQIEV